MDKNRELAERLGIAINNVSSWNAFGKWVEREDIPDFTTDSGKIQLLRLMMVREDWPRFINRIGARSLSNVRSLDCIYVDYMTDTTGKLRDACLEYLKQKGE